MDNYTYAEDFIFTTEIDYIYEYDNIIKSRDNRRTEDDDVYDAASNAPFVMLYAFAGLLAFFVIYAFCLYCLCSEERRRERQERRHQRAQEAWQRIRRIRDTRVPSRSVSENENRRFLPESLLNFNTRPKQLSLSQQGANRMPSFSEDEIREDFEVLLNLNTRTNQLSPSPKVVYQRRPLSEDEGTHDRTFFPEDFEDLLNANARPSQQVGYQTLSLSQELEDFFNNTNQLRSSQQFVYRRRSPSEDEVSQDRRFFPEDFEDLLSPNAHPQQLSPSQQIVHRKPSYIAINTSSPSVEQPDRETEALPERISRSSPPSANVIRRQMHFSEDTPRRPSSWSPWR